MAWLDSELAYYDVAIQYVSHYTTETLIKSKNSAEKEIT